MLHEFMVLNREELTARCRAKAAMRSSSRANATELEHGVPELIDQIIELLRAAHTADHAAATSVPAAIGSSATRYGGEMLHRGFSVDQVVHDYGDLCQALTELASEKHAPITVDEFHTFNRCLDNATAEAVVEFGRQRDHEISEKDAATLNERLGSLAHELRNLLNTVVLAYAAIKSGHVALTGATGAVLDRSLDGLRSLIDGALADVRLSSGLHTRATLTKVDVILEDARVAAQLEASARNIAFTVIAEPSLSVAVDRQMLSSALANLLQNAFKFSRPGGHVVLDARVARGRVLIEVADECGGLPPGHAEGLFRPFEQRSHDRSGLGLGLSISRRAVEANGGTLQVRDIPGTGCVFTIDLPQAEAIPRRSP